MKLSYDLASTILKLDNINQKLSFPHYFWILVYNIFFRNRIFLKHYAFEETKFCDVRQCLIIIINNVFIAYEKLYSALRFGTIFHKYGNSLIKIGHNPI